MQSILSNVSCFRVNVSVGSIADVVLQMCKIVKYKNERLRPIIEHASTFVECNNACDYTCIANARTVCKDACDHTALRTHEWFAMTHAITRAKDTYCVPLNELHGCLSRRLKRQVWWGSASWEHVLRKKRIVTFTTPTRHRWHAHRHPVVFSTDLQGQHLSEGRHNITPFDMVG